MIKGSMMRRSALHSILWPRSSVNLLPIPMRRFPSLCERQACTPSWSHPNSSAPPLNKDSLAARRKSQEMTQKIRSMIDHSKSLWYEMRRSGDQDLWKKQLVSTSHTMHKQEIKKKKVNRDAAWRWIDRSWISACLISFFFPLFLVFSLSLVKPRLVSSFLSSLSIRRLKRT